MAFNGSGVFNRLYNWVQDRDNSIKILAQKMDDEQDGIATGLSTCITKDGQTTITDDIPMAVHKFTGMKVGTANTDTASLGQVQNSGYTYDATDSGVADAYAIQMAPTVTAYVAGQSFRFIAANASTGASTLDVDGVGTAAIEYQGAALTGAEIAAGATIVVEFDGTAFQMTSPSNLLTASAGDMLSANNLSDVADAATSLANIGGIGSLAADTSPQLGGLLDTNSFAINESEGATIADSGTPDIFNNTDGNTVHLAGTTTITDFPDAPSVGVWRKVIFDGIRTLTHGSGITLQGSANITTAAGDYAFVYADAVDAFTVLYFKADGTSPVAPASDFEFVETISPSAAASAAFAHTIAAGYDYIVASSNLKPSADLSAANAVKTQVGTGGGPTFQTASYSNTQMAVQNTSLTGARDDTTTGLAWHGSANFGGAGAGEFCPVNQTILEPAANRVTHTINQGSFFGSGGDLMMTSGTGLRTVAEVVTALRVIVGTGTITGDVHLFRRKLS